MRLKTEMRVVQRAFDRKVQSTKSKWWRQQQEEICRLWTDNPEGFWRKIGQHSVPSQARVPWETIQNDGSINKVLSESVQ